MTSVQRQSGFDEQPSPEWHIASLVAYCLPENFLTTRQQLQSLSFVDIHADDGIAKLVITIEGQNTAELSQHMDRINAELNLMSLQMVFHQYDQLNSDNDFTTAHGPSA